MTREELVDLWRKRPFEPFRIFTLAGERVDVCHPNLMLVAGDLITVGEPHPTQPPPSAGELTLLEVGEITRIEPLTAVPQI
jgi:hypothetical protein